MAIAKIYDTNTSQWIPAIAGATGAAGGFDSQQTVEELSGFGYAVASDDKGKLFTNANALTVTIDNLQVGEQLDFLQTDTGQFTFEAGSGVTLNSKSGHLKTAAQYSWARVKCVATDVYVLYGDLAA